MKNYKTIFKAVDNYNGGVDKKLYFLKSLLIINKAIESIGIEESILHKYIKCNNDEKLVILKEIYQYLNNLLDVIEEDEFNIVFHIQNEIDGIIVILEKK